VAPLREIVFRAGAGERGPRHQKGEGRTAGEIAEGRVTCAFMIALSLRRPLMRAALALLARPLPNCRARRPRYAPPRSGSGRPWWPFARPPRPPRAQQPRGAHGHLVARAPGGLASRSATGGEDGASWDPPGGAGASSAARRHRRAAHRGGNDRRSGQPGAGRHARLATTPTRRIARGGRGAAGLGQPAWDVVFLFPAAGGRRPRARRRGRRSW